MIAFLAATVVGGRRSPAWLALTSWLALAALGLSEQACTSAGGAAHAGSPTKSQLPSSWLDRSLSPDERAKLLVESMSVSEKLTLVTGYFGVQQDWNEYRFPEARPQSAELVRGVPRLSFPPQWQGDAGSGGPRQPRAAAAGTRSTDDPSSFASAHASKSLFCRNFQT